jgi:hypothetical protein
MQIELRARLHARSYAQWIAPPALPPPRASALKGSGAHSDSHSVPQKQTAPADVEAIDERLTTAK